MASLTDLCSLLCCYQYYEVRVVAVNIWGSRISCATETLVTVLRSDVVQPLWAIICLVWISNRDGTQDSLLNACSNGVLNKWLERLRTQH